MKIDGELLGLVGEYEMKNIADDTYVLTLFRDLSPMPPLEVGDWVLFKRADHAHICLNANTNFHSPVIEVRKANGTIWRRDK